MARTPVATDNFNRADTGSDPYLGTNWAQLNSGWGNIRITGNTFVYGTVASPPGVNACVARWVGSGTFTDNQYSEIAILNLSNLAGGSYFVGVICRASADTGTGMDFYCATVDYGGTSGASMTTRLMKITNETEVLLHSAAVAWSNGDKLSLEVEGSELRLCKNGTPLGGSFTQTDTALTTGQPGIIAGGGATVYGDDWEAGNITSGASAVISPSILRPNQSTVFGSAVQRFT